MSGIALATMAALLVSASPAAELPSECRTDEAPSTCKEVRGFLGRNRSNAALVLFKAERRLYFFERGRVVDEEIDLRDYDPNVFESFKVRVSFPVPVALGLQPNGPKREQGDMRTPEGEYRICTSSRASQFTHFLALSYPGPADVALALEQKRFGPKALERVRNSQRPGACPDFQTALGGMVGMHGVSTSQAPLAAAMERRDPKVRIATDSDWTWGCIALENRHLRFLARRVRAGTPILVVP